jgi:hypothetical protein
VPGFFVGVSPSSERSCLGGKHGQNLSFLPQKNTEKHGQNLLQQQPCRSDFLSVFFRVLLWQKRVFKIFFLGFRG